MVGRRNPGHRWRQLRRRRESAESWIQVCYCRGEWKNGVARERDRARPGAEGLSHIVMTGGVAVVTLSSRTQDRTHFDANLDDRSALRPMAECTGLAMFSRGWTGPSEPSAEGAARTEGRQQSPPRPPTTASRSRPRVLDVNSARQRAETSMIALPAEGENATRQVNCDVAPTRQFHPASSLLRTVAPAAALRSRLAVVPSHVRPSVRLSPTTCHLYRRSSASCTLPVREELSCVCLYIYIYYIYPVETCGKDTRASKKINGSISVGSR